MYSVFRIHRSPLTTHHSPLTPPLFSFFRSRRRKKLLAGPLSAAWREILARNVAVYSRLSTWEKPRLEAALRVIAAERRFVGVGGVEVTDEVRVTIAAQAALLLLGNDGYYFERVPTIFVFPQPRADKIGRNVQHGSAFGAGAHVIEEGVIVEGQAFQQGEIRLAWSEVLSGGRDATDGENVVLHEFAHHLDALDGEMGGTPPLEGEAARLQWWEVFDAELAQLRSDLSAGHRPLFHDAAADSRTELFAYATELFFECPQALAEEHAELFEQLRRFYKVDPTSWFADAAPAESFARPFEAAVPRVPLPSEDALKPEAQAKEAEELPPLETADQYFTRGLEFFEFRRGGENVSAGPGGRALPRPRAVLSRSVPGRAGRRRAGLPPRAGRPRSAGPPRPVPGGPRRTRRRPVGPGSSRRIIA
jgi:Mlc titration factor MtfA (ptsG expression regulator)